MDIKLKSSGWIKEKFWLKRYLNHETRITKIKEQNRNYWDICNKKMRKDLYQKDKKLQEFW